VLAQSKDRRKVRICVLLIFQRALSATLFNSRNERSKSRRVAPQRHSANNKTKKEIYDYNILILYNDDIKILIQLAHKSICIYTYVCVCVYIYIYIYIYIYTHTTHIVSFIRIHTSHTRAYVHIYVYLCARVCCIRDVCVRVCVCMCV
jgi:hypothetical protein